MPSGFKLDTKVKGLIQTQQKLEAAAAALHGQPMMDSMTQATLIVEGDAKRGAPVDNGQLRQSITHEIRNKGFAGAESVVGVVGSNRKNAMWMELGTGLPAGHAKVKMPPVSALETWAKRHGLDAFLVARAIWKRGGLEPRRFLQNAFEKNRQRIIDLIGQAVTGITGKANQ